MVKTTFNVLRLRMLFRNALSMLTHTRLAMMHQELRVVLRRFAITLHVLLQLASRTANAEQLSMRTESTQ